MSQIARNAMSPFTDANTMLTPVDHELAYCPVSSSTSSPLPLLDAMKAILVLRDKQDGKSKPSEPNQMLNTAEYELLTVEQGRRRGQPNRQRQESTDPDQKPLMSGENIGLTSTHMSERSIALAAPSQQLQSNNAVVLAKRQQTNKLGKREFDMLVDELLGKHTARHGGLEKKRAETRADWVARLKQLNASVLRLWVRHCAGIRDSVPRYSAWGDVPLREVTMRSGPPVLRPHFRIWSSGMRPCFGCQLEGLRCTREGFLRGRNERGLCGRCERDGRECVFLDDEGHLRKAGTDGVVEPCGAEEGRCAEGGRGGKGARRAKRAAQHRLAEDLRRRLKGWRAEVVGSRVEYVDERSWALPLWYDDNLRPARRADENACVGNREIGHLLPCEVVPA